MMNPYALSQPLKKRLGSTLKPAQMKKLKRRAESNKQPKKRLKHEKLHKHAGSATSTPVLKQLTQYHAQAKPVGNGTFQAKPQGNVLAAFDPLGLIAAAAQEVSDKGEWKFENSQKANSAAKTHSHIGYPLHPMNVNVHAHMHNVDLRMHMQRHSQGQMQTPKSVINPYTVKPVEQNEESRPETSARYTTIEEKALVHAKLRLQISSNMGQKNTGTDSLLTQYYEYYLKLLDPNGFMGYSKREKSALVRKFKSIKSKKPMLVEYLDTCIEKGFWSQLKDIVLSQPNLAIAKQ